MKRSLGSSLKKMGRDASNKYEKHWANKRVRKIANNLSMENGVVGKPLARKISKCFVIERRQYITRGSWWAEDYLRKGIKLPHWTEWKKYKAFEKRGARNRMYEGIVNGWNRQTNHGVRSSIDGDEYEYRVVDL